MCSRDGLRDGSRSWIKPIASSRVKDVGGESVVERVYHGGWVWLSRVRIILYIKASAPPFGDTIQTDSDTSTFKSTRGGTAKDPDRPVDARPPNVV